MDMEFWAGKPIPGDLYRVKLHKEVLLSMNDRGLQTIMASENVTSGMDIFENT